MISRDDIIQRGIETNAPTKNINNALQAYGYEPDYSPISYIGGNILRNASDMARDFRTFTGSIAKPVGELADVTARGVVSGDLDSVKKAFRNTLNNKYLKDISRGAVIGAGAGSFVPALGTLGGAVLGGTIGALGPEGTANAMLSTYNTTVDDIRSGNVDINKVKAGVMRNPLYAGLDFLSLGGAKAIGKGIGGVSKDAPLAIQAIVPSKELRQFNRDVTDIIGSSTAKRADLYKSYNTLEAMPLANRTEIVKNITTNKGRLNKNERVLANAIKQDLRTNEAEAITKGFIPKELSKQNTISQYIMMELGEAYPELNHMSVMDYLANGKNSTAITNTKLLDDIDRLAKEGSKLYDDGKITFLTQAISRSRDPLGNIVARELTGGEGAGYFGTERIIGRSTPYDLGRVLDESIYHQLNQVSDASRAKDIVDNIFSNVGEVVTKKLDKLPNGKVAFNPNIFNEQVAKDLTAGKSPDFKLAISKANVADEGSLLVDKIYMEGLKNVFKPSKLAPIRKLTSSFKKAVLANPHWVMLNRIGNTINNAIGGVGLDDYVDAMNNKNLLPDRLRQQTSFNSYINSGVEGLAQQPTLSLFKQPINRIARGIDKFKDSDKSLGDLGRVLATIFASSSDLTANPLFRLESALERGDRFANFVKQAKDIGGDNWKKVLKEANTNDGLYNKINTRVNKDLGDYLGRNYAIPSEVYEVLGETVPFYRFLTQTGRTSLHQLSNHPLAFNSLVQLPARAGEDMSKKIVELLNLDEDKYEGGYPYKITPWGDIRTIGIEPLPFQAVASDIANILSGKDTTSIASPYLTLASDILNYKKGEYTPTSPRLTELKITRPSEAEDYKPTGRERVEYGLNKLLSTTYNPYRWLTMYGPEIQALIHDRALQSRYDTDPTLENPLSYPRKGLIELIGKWGGVQTRSNYPKYNKGKSSVKKDMRKAVRNINKMNMMKGER